MVTVQAIKLIYKLKTWLFALIPVVVLYVLALNTTAAYAIINTAQSTSSLAVSSTIPANKADNTKTTGRSIGISFSRR